MKKKLDVKKLFEREFGVMNLPSQGLFYEDKTSQLKIRYLSASEEEVLSSYFLNESGEALYYVLKNLIIDDFDVDNLVLPDLQGIMIFLYGTSFGDEIKFQVKCPHCNYEEERPVKLSNLKFKEAQNKPINGQFYLYIPYEKTYDKIIKETKVYEDKEYVEIVLKPITYKRLLEATESGEDLNTPTNRVVSNIISIGGNENKEDITSFITKGISIKSFKQLKHFTQNNEIGVEDKVKYTCIMCSNENTFNLNLGHSFLKLPENHINNVLEECFLLSHYGEGGMSYETAMKLPTSKRRGLITRLQQELEKKREAEEKAYKAAQSKAGTKTPRKK